MGLDMYLRAERFLRGGNYEHEDNQVSADISAAMGGTPGRVESVSCEIGYWRKANAIHAWFVKNCQNGVDECQKTHVSREKLRELLALCQKVKEIAKLVPGKVITGHNMVNGEWNEINRQGLVVENAAAVAALLPSQGGFFFGGTDYDEWYMTYVQHTIDVLEKALLIGDEWSIVYRSSW